MRRQEILFLRPEWAISLSFVRTDFELLSQAFTVFPMSCSEKDLLLPFRLFKRMLTCGICYSWFGGIHSFWAVLIGKIIGCRTVIVSGGYDTVCMPEIGYGIRYEKKGWRRCYWSLRHADTILAFSASAKRDLMSEARVKSAEVVSLGFDTSTIPPGLPWELRERFVVTTCHMSRSNIKRKGLTTLIEAARLLSDVTFILIGRDNGAVSVLRKDIPANVIFAGYLDDAAMYEVLGKSKIYAQLSAHEGFGCALAEAMLCGCIPVVTNRGSLPEVGGPDAIIVEYGDVQATVAAIRNAIESKPEKRFSKWIEENYRLEYREQELLKICSERTLTKHNHFGHKG